MVIKKYSIFSTIILSAILLMVFENLLFAARTDEQDFRYYVKQITKSPRNPEAPVYMHNLINLENNINNPERILKFCKKLSKKRKLPFELRVMTEMCLNSWAWNDGDTKKIEKTIKDLGRITRFKVIGPFDNEAGSGMDKEYEPEKGFDFSASYQGKERPVSWRDYPSINQYNGQQFFDQIFTPYSQSLSYAHARIYSRKNQNAVLLFGVGGEIDVWLNNRKVAQTRGERNFSSVQSAYKIKLKKGINDFLFKVGVKEGDWGFSASLLDNNGKALRGVYGLDHSKNSDKYAPFEKEKTEFNLDNDTRISPFEMNLNRELKKFEKKETAKRAITISKLYGLYNSFSKEEKLNEEFVLKAIELSPKNKDALIHCSNVLGDKNKRFNCMLKGNKLYPKETTFDWKLANFYYEEGLAFKTLEYLLPLLNTKEYRVYALNLYGKMLDGYNWTTKHFELIQKEYEQNRNSRTIVIMKARAEEQIGRTDLAYKTRVELLKTRPGALGTIRWFYEHHYNRHELSLALDYLNEIISLLPGSMSDYIQRAKIYEGLGKIELARKDYKRILEISPEYTDAMNLLAQLNYRFGDKNKAIALWKKSLEIYPQNPDLEEYMREFKPEKEGFETPYIKDALEVLKNNPVNPENREHADKLLNITVWKVFENGLSSKFSQIIQRPLEKSVLKKYRTFYINYSPFEQTVKIIKARIIKPNGDILERYEDNEHSMNQTYKIYYDNRVRVITFPDAEPGDTVELQYRVDDVASENMFSDYFGTLQVIQNEIIRNHWEAIILMPEKRELYYNEPRFVKLTIDNDKQGNKRYRWIGENIPKVVGEPSMPPFIEEADYLHVSTFKDWQTMGSWYWGLVKDQFISNEELKKKVGEITQNITKPIKKVEAIYNWVVTNTRYVGLEFGIHGYKPYQVNEIFKRKFGDCKDKATLLIAMLTEAEIPAQMAIIRTSNMGQIQEYPPSLSMFNHAIAYLPDFDLYLDGTAEFSGMYELPYQDRRGQVMLVGPDFVKFTNVKDVSPNENIYSEKGSIVLNGNNEATVKGAAFIKGSRASSYRSHFQEKERRKEKFEKLINKEHPGSELVNVKFKNIEDISKPVEFEYEAKLKNYLRQEGDIFLVWANYERLDLVKYFASISKRKYPVAISRPQTLSWETTIDLGSKYKVLELPKPVKLSNKFGEFETTYKLDKNRIHVKSSIKYLATRISVEDYAEWRKYCQEVTQAHKEEIRLSYEQ